MTTYAITMGNEVYVYVRGRMVMKRWLRSGTTAMFYDIVVRHWCDTPTKGKGNV